MQMEKSVHVLLEEHLEPLRKFAHKLTRGYASDTDDLIQDACVRVLSRAHQYQAGTNFKSWVFSIMQSIWIDEVRRRAVRNGTDSIQVVPDMYIGSEVPNRLVNARIALNETGEALSKISIEQRDMLMLVCVDGLSYKDAAELTGMPIGTVQSRLCRARQALVTQLGESLAM
jgi:RNA polymerase sigma-70 factor, ECF subfamily